MFAGKWIAAAPALAAGLMLTSFAGPAAAQSASNGKGTSSNGPGSYYKSYGNDDYYVGSYYTNLGYKSDDAGASNSGASAPSPAPAPKAAGGSAPSGAASSGGSNGGAGANPNGGATASADGQKGGAK